MSINIPIIKTTGKSIQKCYECNKDAKWLYMAGDDFEKDCYCEEHVSKGCSCNNLSFYRSEHEVDIEKLENDFKNFKEDIYDRILNHNLYALNFGKREKTCGQHTEEIRDKSEIKKIIDNCTMETLEYYEFIPLDEKGEEYPCCEYWYYPEGVDINDENDLTEEEKKEIYDNYEIYGE